MFIWKVAPLARYFVNSILVCLITMFISVGISCFGAYALNRFRFRGRDTVGMLQFGQTMIPKVLYVLPYYLLLIHINSWIGIRLIGTYFALIVTYIAFTLPINIWMLRGYYETIPIELEEAAMIDGSSKIGALLRITLPLAWPGVIAVGILTFIISWNEVLLASVLTTQDTRTVAVGIIEYETKLVANWGYILSAGAVVSIPLVVLFTFMQKHMVSGMTRGAVKY